MKIIDFQIGYRLNNNQTKYRNIKLFILNLKNKLFTLIFV